MIIHWKNIVKPFTSLNHFILVMIFFVGCGERKSKDERTFPFPYANTSRAVQYVGSEQCKTCHEDIYNSYMQSEMGKAMYTVHDSSRIEQFPSTPLYDIKFDLWYQAESKNGKVYQKEFRRTKNGDITHERNVEAQYIMGSGNNLRMYFYNEGGMFYQHPLTWYVNKTNFDLSPGYKDFGNVRFSRFISAKCLSCHNSYLQPDTTALDRYKAPYSFGIGCERCHGPGELHVKEANGDEIIGLKENSKTIINPRSLPFQQQLDVCQQCHLQGKAWVLNKSNEDYFDFRPGELLATHRSVYFKAKTKLDVIEVGDSPQRLAMSKCFQESNGSMTCITCHNPHFSIKTFTADHYNSKCQGCHNTEALQKKKLSQPHSSNSNCISCHMNRTGSDNTLHGVSNTDHWIRKDANRTKINWTSLRKPTVQPLTQLSEFLGAHDSLTNERMAEAYLYYFNEHDPRSAYLDSALLYVKSSISNNTFTFRSYRTLAFVHMRREQYTEALDAFRKAIELNPNNSELYFEAGNIFSILKKYTEALREYFNAVALKPNEPKYLEACGMANYRMSNFTDAQNYFEEAIQYDSQNGEVYFYLGNIYAMSHNNPEQALKHYQRAMLLQPNLRNGHLNIGNAFALLNNIESAIKEYESELAMYPQSTSAMVNLGKVYIEQGQKEKGRSYLREALKINPTLGAARELLFQ